MLIVKLAWRNLLRNKRRTLLTVMLVGFSLVSLILTDGMVKGMQEKLVGSITQTLTGEAQIHRKGFREELDEKKFIDDPVPIINQIRLNKDIQTFAPRVVFGGMIASPYNINGGLIYGVDAARELGISKIKEALIEGAYLSGSPREILIGKSMSEILEVSLGDRIVISAAEVKNGEISQELFRVSGIFEFGLSDLDNSLGFINLNVAQSLLGLNKGIHQIVVRFKNPENALDLQSSFYQNANSGNIEALSWKDYNPSIASLIGMSNYATVIIGVTLFLLATFGVINSLFMSIYERLYELGVAKAIGTSGPELMSLVILEAFLLGVISCIFGSLVGYFANSWFAVHGIPFGTYDFSGVILRGIHTKVALGQFTLLPSCVIILVLVSAIYPSIFAARIMPVDSMRRSL
ncbi:MAG: ABC transporter permease [Pseudomonadota bacterium]|nr:ABC transporter permease [Pseudomonadota bacterium]